MESPLHVVLANSTRVLAGAERFVLDAAAGLADRGHRVTVQAYPQGPLANAARAAGHVVWPVTTRADGAVWTVLPLASRYTRERVDVVLTNYEKDLRTAGVAARLARRAIAVVHSRECDVPLKARPQYRFTYRRVAHRVLTNSEATRQTTLRSAPWLDPEVVTVLPKGVPMPTPRPKAETASVVLGFAGQLVPRKRCHELLEALHSPPLSGLPWRLRIAGHGPERARLERLADDLFPVGRVQFCGHVDDMRSWFSSIDVLVLPSLVEGFGYVLAEAAAAGRPAVAMRSSSAPEVVRDEVTGLLADPDHPRDLVRCLHRMVTDPSLRQRLGAAARPHAEVAFSLSAMLDGLEHELVQTHRRIAPVHTEAHA